MERREFIKKSSFASGLFCVPHFLQTYAQNATATQSTNRKVVIIQLMGGNDGLNTIVPFRDDIYYQKRPTLGLKQKSLIKLNDEVGVNKSIAPLRNLYDKGYLSILNNVGYPNPNRSHFRSSDIWHTASASNVYEASGWIGRYLEETNSKSYKAIEVNQKLSRILKGKDVSGIAITDVKKLHKQMNNPFIKSIIENNQDRHLSEHNLGYLYSTLIDTQSSIEYIYEKNKTRNSKAEYPQNIFSKQLKTIAQFINSGIDTSIYYAGLTGFDTHDNQLNKQERLLEVYAESIEAFVKDLKKNDTFDDVLILTFSEFGRRVEENGSKGTDHGAANNVFVIGNQLKKQGLYNNLANLNDLDDNGDLKYEIDFREVYATVLDKWLQVNDKNILNKSFSKLNFI